MPPFPIHDHAEAIAQRRILLEAFLDLVKDKALFVLALAVELIKPGGQFARTRRLLRAEKFNYVPRNIHTARSVESRCDPECNFTRGQTTRSCQIGHLQQGLQASIDRRPQSLESQLRENAILPSQRNSIGNRRNRHYLHERHQ